MTHSLRVKTSQVPPPPLPFMLQTKPWADLPLYTPPTTPPATALPVIRTSRSVEREILCKEIAAQEGSAGVARRNHRAALRINAALANAMRMGS